jgi:quercetin dioxygenase-like cupin family protein
LLIQNIDFRKEQQVDPIYTINKKSFLNSDGTLLIAKWAENCGISDSNVQRLDIGLSPRKSHIHKSNATGQAMVSNGQIGADVIQLKANEGFVPHTHPGDHLLIVIGGEGTVTYNGKIYPTCAGQIYLLEGEVPHAVGAITDHVILAIGSPHKPVDSEDRMEIVEYEAVATDLKEVHCLICDLKATIPSFLHEKGCPHCPCGACRPLKY